MFQKTSPWIGRVRSGRTKNGFHELPSSASLRCRALREVIVQRSKAAAQEMLLESARWAEWPSGCRGLFPLALFFFRPASGAVNASKRFFWVGRVPCVFLFRVGAECLRFWVSVSWGGGEGGEGGGEGGEGAEGGGGVGSLAKDPQNMVGHYPK